MRVGIDLSKISGYNISKRKVRKMILYFTGTGNAKYIAEKIANVTGDETKNIVAYTRDNEKFLQGDGGRWSLSAPCTTGVFPNR